MNIPEWFSNRLKAYDRDLRVRWSHERKMYVIEAKGDRRAIPAPVKYDMEGVEHPLPELSDRKIQWRDSVYPILYFKHFSPAIMDIVACNDMRKLGNKKLSKVVENAEAEIEKKNEERREEILERTATEAYRQLKSEV